MLYFLCDNIAWLFRSGLIVGKEKGPRRKATEFYLSGAAFNLLENTRQLLKIVFMERHYSSSEHSQNEMMGEQHFSAQMKHDRIWKQRLYLTICICIRLILDIIVALNILRDDSKDTIFNGICGSLSSIIAFYISWPVKKSISSE
ncbi:hypothetical protein Gasu2_23380 [Galdieria sulphuraria]|nr:hypothetical protein Gasu2_23380 [Galdieria sulphuraria]